jgi:hypothetical protein
MSGKNSMVDQYLSQTPHLEVVDGGKTDHGKQKYHAYTIDKPNNRTLRLRIEHSDQDRTTSTMAKSYLVEVTASADQYIALIFTTAAFMIEGRNLSELQEKLDADQVRSIVCYSPVWYQTPADDAAVITNIRRIALQELVPLDRDTSPAGVEEEGATNG